MNTIINLIGTPLGYVMWVCYYIIKNYGLAIILFTFLTKIVLFPISLKVQKNSIKMVKLKPQLDEIAVRYAGDKDKIAEEQIKLYDEEHYSPAAGCLPMLLQIPLILGVINVIYNPLKHLLHLDSQVISAFVNKTMEILSIEKVGSSMHMKVIQTVNNSQYLGEFQSLQGTLTNYNVNEIINSIQNFDVSFLGMNLLEMPSIFNVNIIWFVPVLATLSVLLLCIIQNKENVLQREQGFFGKWGVSIFLILFTLYFTFTVPVGVGIYWIFTNLFSIVQIYILNAMYNPKKYIDYEAKAKSEARLLVQKKIDQEKKEENKKYKGREKQDYKRFFDTENKQLVFYSVKSGFYKYFENVINYILENSDITIHYVTSDPNDKIFSMKNEKIVPYYIGEKKLITFMMKIDSDIVVMTMPDLEKFHIKRSYVRKDIEYIYMFHAPLSFIMTLREGAIDHYDTIFCTGKEQVEEIRTSEKVYGLKEKKLVECGYGVIENMREHYLQNKSKYDNKTSKNILIAPSWHNDNILDSCIDEILDNILDKGWNIILRPHPEYVKRYSERMNAIIDKYKDRFSDKFTIETDFTSNETVYSADILITDWSGIAYEYSLATLKPSIFINTEMKVTNPNWQKVSASPSNLYLRNEIGIELNKDELQSIEDKIRYILSNYSEYENHIKEIQESMLYNFGQSGEAGGKYIIDSLEKRKSSV